MVDRPSWWSRLAQALYALDRLVLRTPCEVCGDRRRCWRWHVEVFDCPVCRTPIDEFHPQFERVLPALNRQPLITYTTGTYASASTITLDGWTLGGQLWNTR